MGQGATMFAGGLLEMKIGPRYTALLGGFVMSGGVMLSAVAVKVSFWLLLFTYGVLFGVGSGFAYIAPLVCAMRWLPKWKGVANGAVVSGFGLGALLFDFLQTLYLNPNNLDAVMSETGDSFFTDAEVLSRVPTSFLIFGGVYMAMQLVGCALLTNPAPKQRPRRESAKDRRDTITSTGTSDVPSVSNPECSLLSLDTRVATTGAITNPKPAEGGMELEVFTEEAGNESGRWTTNIISSVMPLKMLKTPNFYHLWVVHVLNVTALACVITMYKLIGQSVMYGDHFLAATGSVAAIFNFAGRLFWGFLTDLITFKLAIVCITAFTTVLTLTFYAVTITAPALFFIWVCAFFFCVGGIFVAFPTAIARSYGPKYIGVNYGLLFTGHIVSGVVSSVISSSTVDWPTFFLMAAAFSALAFVLMMCFRNKRYILARSTLLNTGNTS